MKVEGGALVYDLGDLGPPEPGPDPTAQLPSQWAVYDRTLPSGEVLYVVDRCQAGEEWGYGGGEEAFGKSYDGFRMVAGPFGTKREAEDEREALLAVTEVMAS